MRLTPVLLILIALSLSVAPRLSPAAAQPPPDPAPDVVRHWMATALDAVQSEALTPPVASRLYAYTAIALYEALQHADPAYPTLAERLNGLDSLPQPGTGTHDWSVVANHTAAQVLGYLVPRQGSVARARAAFDLEPSISLPLDVFDRSRAYARQLADALIVWIADDNYAQSRSLRYVLPVGDPLFWVPLEGQTALEPFWGVLRPFATVPISRCEVPLRVPFSTDPDSLFFSEAMIVYLADRRLTDDQRRIADFWADGPGETATPPGHWVSIVNQVIAQHNLPLLVGAQAHALTAIALADSFISCWDTKYRDNLLRPITYIRNYIDPDWDSYIQTPPFPEYPSGHSVASGAAATVLTALLGDLPFVDDTHRARGMPPRRFRSFHDAAREAAISRLYGGIHYIFGIENGLLQGQCIGETVLERLWTPQR